MNIEDMPHQELIPTEGERYKGHYIYKIGDIVYNINDCKVRRENSRLFASFSEKAFPLDGWQATGHIDDSVFIASSWEELCGILNTTKR